MQTSRDIKKAAAEALEMLTPWQKTVWNLCRKQGLSTWQAAERLNRSQPPIYRALKLAEKKFISQLEKIRESNEYPTA